MAKGKQGGSSKGGSHKMPSGKMMMDKDMPMKGKMPKKMK